MAEALAEASRSDGKRRMRPWRGRLVCVWRAGDVNPPTGTAESSQHRHRRRGGRGGRGGPMRDRELTRRAEKRHLPGPRTRWDDWRGARPCIQLIQNPRQPYATTRPARAHGGSARC